MSTALVGNTGFVGSNLAASFSFDHLYHSKNIQEAFGSKPDLLVYAGIRAEMFLANQAPEQDLGLIINAMENIRLIEPRRVVLISTTAVYADTVGKFEDSVISLKELAAYGRNRYILECWVRDNFREHLIVRLPALFGENIKKNFIYDFINRIPAMLKNDKYQELSSSSLIKEAYQPAGNGFLRCVIQKPADRRQLREEFNRLGFSALNFTDSRSVYQFYHLAHLWDHISKSLDSGIQKLNVATEPICISELYQYLTGKKFINELSAIPYHYDMRTKHTDSLGGCNGYLFQKGFMLEEIKEFIGRHYD